MAERPGNEVIAKRLRRLGRETLVDKYRELAQQRGRGRVSVGAAVDFLIDNLPDHELLALAAQGSDTPRNPPLRGFIWRMSTGGAASGDALSTAISELAGAGSGDLLDLQLEQTDLGGEMGATVYWVTFHTEEWGTIDTEWKRTLSTGSAYVAIDAADRILTVFTGAHAVADALGSAIAEAIGVSITPVRLGAVAVPDNLPPAAAKLSGPTLELLEIIYGRFAEQFEIGFTSYVNSDPMPSKQRPERQGARHSIEDVILTDDIRSDLMLGDLMRTVRFSLTRANGGDDSERQPLHVEVTIDSDVETGLVLTVAGASTRREEGLGLYEDLRRAVMRKDASDGVGLAAIITRIAAGQ